MRLLTIRQAAEALGLRPPTMRAWVAQRKVEYVKLGRSVRISSDVIDAMIQAATVPAKPRASRL